MKTEGMVPAREAEQQRTLIKDLQRDLENLKTKHGSLQQEHSTIIATLRQLTARREQMEVRRRCRCCRAVVSKRLTPVGVLLCTRRSKTASTEFGK